MAKGIRHDSLFFGIKLGDNREDFYGKCFDLNKQKLVTQGVGFSVQYDFIDSLTQKKPMPMRMMFYGEFDSLNVMKGMNMEFTYPGWTPGFAGLQSDSLAKHTAMLLKKWYGGNDFVEVKMEQQDVPVKVDGNRRIMIIMEDQHRVLVRIHDMMHPDYTPKGLKVAKK